MIPSDPPFLTGRALFWLVVRLLGLTGLLAELPQPVSPDSPLHLISSSWSSR